MTDTKPRPGSDLDQAILLAIQSALQTVIVDGTRYASDLKKFDKIIEINEDRLKLEPTNKLYRADHESKLAMRDECHKQIKDISGRVAQELYGVYRQLFSAPMKADAKKKHGSNPNTSSHEDQKHLPAHAQILEKQLQTNEEEMHRIRVEHRQIIETLQQQVAAQEEEIQLIKQLLQQGRTCVDQLPQPISEDTMAIDERANPENQSLILPTPGGQDLCSVTKAVLCEQRETLDQVITEITDLRTQVVSYLTEIPQHLQRTVRMIQEDVQSTLQSTAASHLSYLTELIQNIVTDFENRLGKLESFAYRLSPSLNITTTTTSSSSPSVPPAAAADQQQQHLLRKRSPDSIPTPSLLNLPSPKDPRLLRRQSTASSAETTKSSPQINAPSCAQQ
ncbi:hypothetical protein PCANC_06671 [Puccinia coronata f. sp. avenae]|uniref:Uncharacterized protein n=1 Tax=Puccinia coronata f. sp. avenae TaxID=200324 RepID=A0A2N5SE85_9BASI|nr:hypothetical protein PCASD_22643 [Puccinia coronata f. sp. avenae]PLW53560.1 hypothetical protein PCANC_06671 [Puccinia coronata f. sp. avenae]